MDRPPARLPPTGPGRDRLDAAFPSSQGPALYDGQNCAQRQLAGVVFGFQLGTFFSVAMIALAGGSVLYDTSKILHHYPQDRYVGAALELFASVALMLWYVLRLFMSRR